MKDIVVKPGLGFRGLGSLGLVSNVNPTEESGFW